MHFVRVSRSALPKHNRRLNIGAASPALVLLPGVLDAAPGVRQ